MIKEEKKHSDETGLQIVLILCKYFLQIDDLHFGLWTPKLKKTISNLPRAMEKYTNHLISHIPEGTRSVLIAGGDTGHFAEKLVSMGYTVDYVSHKPIMTKLVSERLNDRSHIFECCFKDLKTARTYDLILFRETFKKMSPDICMDKCLKLLNKNGNILICDLFQKDTGDKNPFGETLKLSQTYSEISKYPFEITRDIDITDKTSPTMDILNDILLNVGAPVFNLLLLFLKNKYAQLFKLIHFRYKNKLENLTARYFSGGLNAERFSFFHSYRLVVINKKSEFKHDG